MYYTGKGDKGDTSLFGSKKRVGKDSLVVEALGNLDELNTFIGLYKSKTKIKINVEDESPEVKDILGKIQNDIFTIQAEIASNDGKFVIKSSRTDWLEDLIEKVGGKLKPIKSFLVPGANEDSAFLDVLRTIARRTERRVVAGTEEKNISDEALSYLNRLSSLFYVMARYAAQTAGDKETPPDYSQK